jgi:hypothetical protein
MSGIDAWKVEAFDCRGRDVLPSGFNVIVYGTLEEVGDKATQAVKETKLYRPSYILVYPVDGSDLTIATD